MTDRVLVTGAAGFIGRHLVHELLSQGHEVVATDIDDPPSYLTTADERGELRYEVGNIVYEQFLDELLTGSFDRVYHLAAVVGVGQYVETPLRTMEVNVVGTKQLLERFTGTDTRFTFASSSEVYAKNPDVPWAEDDDRVLGPATTHRWSYSTSKSACEHMIHALTESGDLEATVVRPFNVYGPHQRPNFVLSAFTKAAVTGETLQVFDDGTQTRSPTYIDDFIEGVITASTAPEGRNEVFNIGGTREVEIGELARLVLDLAGRDDDPEYVSGEEVYDEGYEDLDRRIPDVTRARERLGWEATTTLEDGIRETLDWARQTYA